MSGISVFLRNASIWVKLNVSQEILACNDFVSQRLELKPSISSWNAQIIDFYPIFKEVPVAEVTLDDVVEPAPYVFAFADTESMLTIEKALNELPNLVVHVDLAPKDMPGLLSVQVTDVGSNKYHAVSALRQLVHSTKEETLAIGDSTNDLFLFDNAGTKVAMGNAVAELKSKADYVVASIDDDGFAEAMHRFVLV